MRGLKRASSRTEHVQVLAASKKVRNIPFYFDRLPENALENIVRFFSSFPRSKDWSSHIDIDAIAPLYRTALSAFLASRFNALCVVDLTDFSFEADVYRWKRSVYHVLWTESVDTARNLMETITESEQPIPFDTLTIRDPRGSSRFTDMCIRTNNFTQLRSLSVVKHGGGLLEKFGRHLQVLQLGILPPIAAIEAHCPNLRELVLNELDGEKNSMNLWRHLGPTLESLSVEFLFPCEREIQQIQQHCRKLTRIHIDQPAYLDDSDDEFCCPDGSEALSVALASYGAQLESASVKDMSSDQLELIVNACANVKVDLRVMDDGEGFLLPSLKALGSFLNTAIVSLHSHIDLTEGWNLCGNLREIRIFDDCAIESVRQLMAAPKPLLKSVRLSLCDGDDAAECMNAFAGGSGALEEIHLKCSLPRSGMFDEIVRRNKRLASVALYAHEDAPENTMISIVESLLKAPALEALEAHQYCTAPRSILAIKKICSRYRRRRVCVSVLGVSYLQ